MNPRISSAIARSERVIAALKTLAELPCAAPFDFSCDEVSVGLLQFFPAGHKRPGGHRDIAKPFCRVLGGVWTVREGGWECDRVTFAGLERCAVTLHYIEPMRELASAFVDLSEHPPFSSVEARP